jgi:hypothetical protein
MSENWLEEDNAGVEIDNENTPAVPRLVHAIPCPPRSRLSDAALATTASVCHNLERIYFFFHCLLLPQSAWGFGQASSTLSSPWIPKQHHSGGSDAGGKILDVHRTPRKPFIFWCFAATQLELPVHQERSQNRVCPHCLATGTTVLGDKLHIICHCPATKVVLERFTDKFQRLTHLLDFTPFASFTPDQMTRLVLGNLLHQCSTKT